MNATQRYVALLRGINVGGRNLIPMADLRDGFDSAGYGRVKTYIQSGNVLFESGTASSRLENEIEEMLLGRFGIELVVVVKSGDQLRRIVEQAPDGFGAQPGLYHSDVIFLKHPLSTTEAMSAVRTKEGVDQAWMGDEVLYFARLSTRRTQSKLGRIVGTPQYRLMTIRNWSTTTKLLGLLEDL